MKRWSYLLIGILCLSLVAGLFVFAYSTTHQVQAGTISILTNHNDNARTGQNLNETILTTSNVSATNFGKLFSLPVDGSIYAQPLYVPNLFVAGASHNVVFVATMHNSVYAFDADHAGNPLWQINLGPSITLPDPNTGTNCGTYKDISTEIGIVSTPVIDAGSATMYVVAKTKENGNYIFRLHALDIGSGQHKSTINGGQPMVIQASSSGSGAGSSGGTITFNNAVENQRPGLLEANGNIYIAFASYCDTGSYHGWILGYNASNLSQFAVANTTPNGSEGGIWEAGQGLSFDGSYIYVMTGNGDSDSANGVNLGEAFVKYNPSNLSVVDWFMPNNFGALNGGDLDLGSSGPLLVPGTNLIVGGGKQGIIYVMHTNSMGHYHAGSDSQIVQSWQATQGHIHGSPVYWNGPNGPHIYTWAEYSHLVAFSFNGTTFNTTPSSQSANPAPNGMPGAMMSISANGSTAGSGIIWASLPYNADANNAVVEGELHAFDASNVSKELWNSKMNDSRDHYGNFAKFNPPTVVNGKVYMGTFSNVLNVYGLLNPPAYNGLAASFNNNGISNDTTPAQANFDGVGYSYSAQALSGVGLNSGANVTSNGITFKWTSASPGTNDNTTATAQTINFSTALQGTKIGFLGSATHGPITDTVVINYTDGSSQSSALTLSDWTLNAAKSAALPNNRVVATTTYRNGTAGKQTVNTYIFETDIGLSAGKQVKGIVLPNNPLIHIFAVNTDGTGTTSTATPTKASTPTNTPVGATATPTNTPTAGGISVKYEAESLTSTTNGPANTVSNDVNCSGGVCMVFQATAIGNVVTYTVNITTAGTYDLRVGVKKLNNKGIFQFASNGVTHGTTQDLYSATAAFPELDIGSVTFNTTGTKSFTFTVTGKNAASSGYTIGIDYIKLTK